MKEWNVDSLLSDVVGSDGYTSAIDDGEEPIKTINGVAPIDKATEEQLTFCSSKGEAAILSISKSKAGVILCKKGMQGIVFPRPDLQQRLIFLDNPRLATMKIMNLIYKNKLLTKISDKATISKNAKIGKDCYIGDFTIIEDDCEIGDNTIIYPRVTILQNSKIGNNCIIQSGATIGADGFAYERNKETLELEAFPHIAGVTIGDNVQIDSNCSIARGSLSDTIIGNGTKLDALVHVAHNVEIGQNCELTAGVIIGGSTIIGDTCWFGLNSTLKNKIRIGNKVIVGCGAAVMHDIEDEDIVGGVPAKSIRDKIKSSPDQLFLMAGQKKETALDSTNIRQALA
jgi:UDP-3-O-[3-hydroxymyristoyl] glucosamine N-acyltransferase